MKASAFLFCSIFPVALTLVVLGAPVAPVIAFATLAGVLTLAANDYRPRRTEWLAARSRHGRATLPLAA